MTTPETNITEEFYIVDFDRTLVDSDKLLEVFIEITEQHIGIPKEQIEAADRDIKNRGDSFDTAGYVRDHLTQDGRREEWEVLEKQFIHESRSLNYLLAGAAELLDWLDSNKKPYGILTYGNPLWQRLKLTAAGFNHVPHIVMQQKEKGKLVSGWLKEGMFDIPQELGGGHSRAVVMIDDKAVSFADFPEAPSRGYWVLDPSHELPSQQGSVPANVTRHSDLHSVLESF